MKNRNMQRAMLLAALTAASAVAAAPDQLLGTWLTPNGQSKIAITKCDDRLCGAITWMQTPRNDEKNADATQRQRPLVGAQIASGFQHDGGSSWNGKLYAPERGKSMDAKLVLVADDSLEVRVSVGMVKKTVTWTRVKQGSEPVDLDETGCADSLTQDIDKPPKSRLLMTGPRASNQHGDSPRGLVMSEIGNLAGASRDVYTLRSNNRVWPAESNSIGTTRTGNIWPHTR